MKKLKWLFILLATASCTASGSIFNESNLPKSKGAIIIVYREDAMFYAARKFPISVNGQVRCSLHNGGFFIVDDTNGQVAITSSLTDQDGISSISIDTKSAKTTYVRISLYKGRAYAAASGGLIGLVGAAASTGGPFMFEQVNQDQAKQELQTLRQDCQ